MNDGGMACLGLGIGVPLLLLLWAAALYNGLVRANNTCAESWSDIDTELKRRYDLIPNLVATVQGYAKHEKEVLEKVTASRNAAVASTGLPQSQAKDENVLVHNLRHMFAVAESYPDLKADRNFLELQQELANTEDRIQRARRFYNGNVRELNVMVEAFPTSIVAGMFGFQRREFFEIEDSSMRAAPDVKFTA